MELLIAWRGARVGKRIKRVWVMIPLCLMCIIWHERNMTCFEGLAHLFKIRSFLASYLYNWDKGECNPSLDQFMDSFDYSHTNSRV